MTATISDRSHTPIRTCIGCRRSAPSAEMVRCTSTASGASVQRAAHGRGAWVCSASCFHTAIAKRAFAKAWKRPVDEAELAALQIAFEAVISNMKDLPAAGGRPGRPVPTKG